MAVSNGINPRELGIWDRFLFLIGWLNIFNIFFWMTLIGVNAHYREKKLFNPRAFQVVYLSGWISLVSFAIIVILVLVGFVFIRDIFPFNLF